MAEIKGSDSDAVQVEAHSLLETSTPIADTETQDRSQDGQLSCKEEVKGMNTSEGEISELSTNVSQQNVIQTLQPNEVVGESTSTVEETMQQNNESSNPVPEVDSSQLVEVDDIHRNEALDAAANTEQDIVHTDIEVETKQCTKPKEGDGVDALDFGTAIQVGAIQQVNESNNLVPQVDPSLEQKTNEIHSIESSHFVKEDGVDAMDSGTAIQVEATQQVNESNDLEQKTNKIHSIESSHVEKEIVQEINSITDAKVGVQEDANFEDGDKISVPDPSMIDNNTSTSVPSSSTEQNEPLIEGAWADILGSGQLKKKTMKHGKPNSRPVTSAICTINMSGLLSNGNIVDVHENFKFQLGDLEVIQGIDLIVALMDVGEVSQVEIGPRFAYGSMGNRKDIPKESTVLYTVELLAVEKEKDLEDYTLEERLKTGNQKRERGNYWYSRSDYPSSIQCYRRALEYLDTENETETDSPDKLQEILDDRLKVYNNMGAAQMKIEAYDAALKSVEHVLRCQKDNVKAIYRKAKIVTELGRISEAIALLERALHLDPSNRIIQQDLMRLQAKQKSDVAKERSLYKKMFQLNDTPTPVSHDKPKIKLAVPWTLMIGAVTAFVASYVTYRYKLF